MSLQSSADNPVYGTICKYFTPPSGLVHPWHKNMSDIFVVSLLDSVCNKRNLFSSQKIVHILIMMVIRPTCDKLPFF
jgi:hypothetical protein